MKDSYSFDRDAAGLDESYAKHIVAYDRIFDRTGLEWYRVESDVGMMGGTGAHEYMAPCPAGENDVALAPGYAANVEVASAEPQPVEMPPPLAAPAEAPTPGATTIEAVAGQLGVAAGRAAEVLPGRDGRRRVRPRRRARRPPRQRHQAHEPPRRALPARAGRGDRAAARPARLHRPRRAPTCRVLLDAAVADGAPGGWVAGANRPDVHLQGVEPGRDFAFERCDVRTVEAGDLVERRADPRSSPRSRSATSSSSARATASRSARRTSTRSGKEQPIVMGSYGIGPARIVAAAIEQTADERGIAWPRSLAPWQVQLVALGKAGTPERDAGEALYEELRAAGLDVLYDDRAGGAGEKFADAELLGCPLRLTVGRRTLEDGLVEVQVRRGQVELAPVPLRDGAAQAVEALLREAPVSPGLTRPALLRPGPLRAAAPGDAARRAAAPVDDPERHRLRAPRADPGVPVARVGGRRRRRRAGVRLRRHRAGRLRRRHRGARDRPVQPARGDARPGRRPAAGHRGRRRLLELRARAALAARDPDRPRGADAHRRPARAAPRRRAADQLVGALGRVAGDGRAVPRPLRPGASSRR